MKKLITSLLSVSLLAGCGLSADDVNHAKESAFNSMSTLKCEEHFLEIGEITKSEKMEFANDLYSKIMPLKVEDKEYINVWTQELGRVANEIESFSSDKRQSFCSKVYDYLETQPAMKSYVPDTQLCARHVESRNPNLSVYVSNYVDFGNSGLVQMATNYNIIYCKIDQHKRVSITTSVHRAMKL